jgi:hypothetical protein
MNAEALNPTLTPPTARMLTPTRALMGTELINTRSIIRSTGFVDFVHRPEFYITSYLQFRTMDG